MMDTDELKAHAENAFGKVEAGAGRALNDPGMEASGKIRQLKSGAETAANAAASSAKEAVARIADQAKDAINTLTDQASDLYNRSAAKAQSAADTLDPLVREKPYTALGLAALAGFVIGLVYASGRPRTVYLRPRD